MQQTPTPLPTPSASPLSDSFVAALELCRGRAERLCREKGWSREDAEEIAQEAILRAVRFQDRYTGQYKVATWFFTLFGNYLCTYARLHKKRPTIPIEERIDGGVTPDFALKEWSISIRQVLYDEPPRLVDTYLYYILHRVAQADLVGISGCGSECTLSQAFVRCKNKVRERLTYDRNPSG